MAWWAARKMSLDCTKKVRVNREELGLKVWAVNGTQSPDEKRRSAMMLISVSILMGFLILALS